MTYKGQKNRTPNAAQKDQHKPVWNATIRIPITLQSPSGSDGDSSDGGNNDGVGDDSDCESTDDSSIRVEVFVQEMHDDYASYGHAKLSLAQLCAPPSNPALQSKGGWLQLG